MHEGAHKTILLGQKSVHANSKFVESWYLGMTEKNAGILLFWNESVVRTQVRRKVEVGTLLLGNDKSNIIANKVLSYF